LYVLTLETNFSQLTTAQAKVVDDHPVVWLGFEEDCILTTCKNGESTNFLTAIASQAPSFARSTQKCAMRLVLALWPRNTRLMSHVDPQFAFVELEHFVEADKGVDR
jgi:hypothetical protein